MKNTHIVCWAHCFFRVLKDIKQLLTLFYLKWSELFLQCCQEVEENIRPLWKRKILAMKKKTSLFTKLNRLFLYQEFLLLKPVLSRYLFFKGGKGQLFSECLFDFLNFPKNHPKIWQISAQEHERCWNHQNKDNALYYYNSHMTIWTI